MGRESRVIKPRSLVYWPNRNGSAKRTTMTRVTDAKSLNSLASRMVRWYLDGLWTRNKRLNAATGQVSTSVQVSSTGVADRSAE